MAGKSTKRKKNSIARHENGNKSAYGFLAPYLILFSIFIIIPIIIAIGLSFTSFNTIQAPTFKAFLNYVNLITQDEIFMQYVLPNTIKYALIVGPGGYILAFLIAWALSQLTSVPRTILAIIFYSPSMTGAVAMAVVWKIIFSGDQMGLINNWLMNPQMLFGAVMAIVNAFQNGVIGVQLSGANPTPGYAGQLIVNHIEDYGFIRYEMGYAAAVSVILLLIVMVFSKVFGRLFSEN